MAKKTSLMMLLVCLIVTLAIAQHQPHQNRTSTRPPENNDSTLRPLTPEEIPPNLNFTPWIHFTIRMPSWAGLKNGSTKKSIAVCWH